MSFLGGKGRNTKTKTNFKIKKEKKNKDRENMGSVLTRNRFWWYRSLYDDYVAREAKGALVII